VITNKRTKAGFALVIILWIVTILGTITMLFSRKANLSLKVSKNVNESIVAELIAEAGIYHLMAVLVQDDEETLSDNLNEIWYNSQQNFYNIPMGKGVYRLQHPDLSQDGMIAYGATDECSKLNINLASREMLMALPESNEEIADCILDWRDEDSDPREFGAEDEYYLMLDEPFVTKNAMFDTLDELLLVKNITIDLIYGEDINTNGILDPNENDGDQSYPIDNSDGVLNKGWYPFITCYSYEKNVDQLGNARININSANKESMKESLGETLTDTDIDSIISARNSNQFQSIGDLLNNAGGNTNRNNASSSVISKDKLKEIADKITVSDEEKLQGRININTAPREVLQALFGEEQQDIVQAIIEKRTSEEPFDSIGGLLDIESLSNTLFQTVSNLVCTKSSVFSVRAIGQIEETKAYKEIYAILDRGETPPQIRYWKVLR
jgi:type II secretory pathway component PulK